MAKKKLKTDPKDSKKRKDDGFFLKKSIREDLYKLIPPSGYPSTQIDDIFSDLFSGKRRMQSMDELPKLFSSLDSLDNIKVGHRSEDLWAAYKKKAIGTNISTAERNKLTKGIRQASHEERTQKRELKEGRDSLLGKIDDITGGMGLHDEDLWLKFLGLKQIGNSVIPSKHRPTKSEDPNAKYYTLKHTSFGWQKNLLDQLKSDRTTEFPTTGYGPSGLANLTLDKGKDEKGEYISVYDVYDFDVPGQKAVGKPFEIFDRIYIDDKGNLKEPKKKEVTPGRKKKQLNQFQQGGKPPGNPPTRAQAFPINLDNPMKADILKQYPAFSALGDFNLYPDTSFTRSKTGAGSIEFFGKDQEQITYPSGFVRQHPSLGRNATVYDPATNDQQSNALDLLHGLPDADENYRNFRNTFSSALFKSHGGDYKKALKEQGSPDGERRFKENYIDGKLRNLMFEGTPEEFKKARYNPNERQDLFTGHPKLKSAFNNLNTYVRGGKGSKKKIALKRYGGNVGILSPMPSLQMPQRGMNPASPAFPSTGFSVMNVSGNHLRDKRAVGGKLPTYQGGGFTNFLNSNAGGISGLAGMGSGLLASIPTPEGKPGTVKAAGAGALSGLAAGAAFGPIGMAAGAVIGGLTGWLKKRSENKAAEEQAALVAQQTKNTMRQSRFNKDASSIGLFPTDGIEGVNNYYTALGGFPAAEYEAEGEEVVMYAGGGQVPGGEPTAFNGVLDNVSSNMAVIEGASHAEGGVDMAGGEFVFSKKMKASKELRSDLHDVMGYTPKDNSYAGIAESIGKKMGVLEEKLESHDPIAMKTAEVMMERYDEALELAASEQEFRKTKVA
jgi:hypothetical protein